jgi:hypothetical protein
MRKSCPDLRKAKKPLRKAKKADKPTFESLKVKISIIVENFRNKCWTAEGVHTRRDLATLAMYAILRNDLSSQTSIVDLYEKLQIISVYDNDGFPFKDFDEAIQKALTAAEKASVNDKVSIGALKYRLEEMFRVLNDSNVWLY